MIDMARIPEGWWLYSLREERTRQVYAGDKHLPTGEFICDLQHVDGGMLQEASGATADDAFYAAIHKVMMYEREHPRG